MREESISLLPQQWVLFSVSGWLLQLVVEEGLQNQALNL